ncbi:glycosyltransferase family 2 protein [Labrenzia sp. OB1]|uniref:glycosyltransferase family 2 protein n=1 Tax=Labrenzia sp. OB1 TaxID=1561204 RepID=UPI0008393CD3|nr:glycosyltransferase family 2 protein [Labrenzia sp. OB1]
MGEISDRLREAFGTQIADSLKLPADGVIAVVLAYNEALRFPYFLEHHRALGVRHFIVIDNNSADGTGALLADQPDVSVILTEKPYKDHKSEWRQLLCDRYLEDRWVLFPDVDELFVYPGWPDLPVESLAAYLDEGGFRALFCPMVDMYPQGPLKELAYRPGESFLKTCSWFDAEGYRYNPLKGSHAKRYKTPERHVFGGTRERLFHQAAKRPQSFFDKLLLSTLFSLRATAPGGRAGRKLDHLLFKPVKNALPSPAAVQSKIPLLKWETGYRFSGGVHGIDRQVAVAPDWGALLHFKYLDDFESKVFEALERKQHTDNAGHYLDYNVQMSRLLTEGLHYSGSTLFSGVQSLIDCGLMRESSGFRRWLSENSTGADQNSAMHKHV